MQLDKLYDELGLIAEQVKRCIQASMEKNGENDKIGENTLIDSHLYDELDVSNVDLELIKVLINNYYKYVEWGMKPGNWVDEKYLIPWMAEKGISNDNGEVWYIQKSIYEEGITGRPFLDEGFDMLDEYWDEWADRIFEILMEDIDDWFSN